MKVLDKLPWMSDHGVPSSGGSAPGVSKTNLSLDTGSDDDDTELLNSMASLSVFSSSHTIQDHSFSSFAASTQLSHTTNFHSCYRLQKNQNDCLGFLKAHTSVDSVETIPTELAMLSGRPIFYVLTEISNGQVSHSGNPGNVFSHPLLLEALESLFVAVIVAPQTEIENESAMEDDEFSFSTNTLCVKQVGFLDESGRHIIAPLAFSDFSVLALGVMVMTVLMAKQQIVPQYVRDLVDESSHVGASPTNPDCRRAWFGLEERSSTASAYRHLEGVCSAEMGCLAEYEGDVVEVLYDAKVTSYSTLVRFTLRMLPDETAILLCQSNDERVAALVEAGRLSEQERKEAQHVIVQHVENCNFKPSANLFALKETPMRCVPLTAFQAAKANTLIQKGQLDDAVHLLSPRQGLILIEAKRVGPKGLSDGTERSILDAWIELSGHAVQSERGAGVEKSVPDEAQKAIFSQVYV